MSKPDCDKCGRSLNGVSIHYHGRDTVCAQCKIDILTLKVSVLEDQIKWRDSVMDEIQRRGASVYRESMQAYYKAEMGEQEEVRS